MVRRLRLRRRRRRSLAVRLFWRVRNGLFNTARGLGFIIFSSVRQLFEFPITGMRNLLRRIRNYLESTKNTAVEEKKAPTVKRKKVPRVKKKKVPALEEKKVSAVEEKKISAVEENKVVRVEEKKITAVEETKVPTLEDKPEMIELEKPIIFSLNQKQELDQEELDALRKEMDTNILEQLQMMEIGINSLDGNTEELFGTDEQTKQYLLRRNEMKDLILLQQLVDASIEEKLMMHKTE